MNTYVAIDPMALVLSDKAYLIYVELKHPHVPALDAVKQTMQRLSADDRRLAVAQAKSLAEYGRAVLDAAAH
ncbi:MAG: hypothetical protein WDN25_18760 [Acetobacteraceae bacterium]